MRLAKAMLVCLALLLIVAGCAKNAENQSSQKTLPQTAAGKVLKPVPVEKRQDYYGMPPEVLRKMGYDPESCKDWIACRINVNDYGPAGKAVVVRNEKTIGVVNYPEQDVLTFPVKIGDRMEIHWVPKDPRSGTKKCQITFWKVLGSTNIDPEAAVVPWEAIADVSQEVDLVEGNWFDFGAKNKITVKYNPEKVSQGARSVDHVYEAVQRQSSALIGAVCLPGPAGLFCIAERLAS